MGFSHSMTADVAFKPGVTVNQAIAALAPLSKYHGWIEADLIAGVQLYGEDRADITELNGEIQQLTIYTSGEVVHSYQDFVDAFAKELESIAEAGSIELRDHDTGDLENAITKIWYGEPSEVAAAKLSHAWIQAEVLMRAAGVSEIALMAAKKLIQADSKHLALQSLIQGT